MSALSSATRIRAPVFDGSTTPRRCRSGRRALTADASVVGSQRSASSTYGMAPPLVEGGCRRGSDPFRRQVGCPRPNVTVKVVPRPSWLADRDAAAMKASQLLHEGQANARAFVGTGTTVLDAVEPFEHARQVVLGMPTPVSATRSST